MQPEKDKTNWTLLGVVLTSTWLGVKITSSSASACNFHPIGMLVDMSL